MGQTYVDEEKRQLKCLVVTPQRLREVWPVILAVPVPVYIEDNETGLGECAVCGNKGVMGRCVSCGLWKHYSCVGPKSHSVASDQQECPRCRPPDRELPEEPWKMGIHNPKFEAGTIRPPLAQPGEDGRVPCPVDVRPTDAEAVAHGFKDGLEWYSYYTSGDLF